MIYKAELTARNVRMKKQNDICQTNGYSLQAQQLKLEGRDHVWCFDYLRIPALLAVIFMHAASGTVRQPVTPAWQVLNLCLSAAFTAVPLFFMMSGYLLMTDQRTADVQFLIRNRLPKLFCALIYKC